MIVSQTLQMNPKTMSSTYTRLNVSTNLYTEVILLVSDSNNCLGMIPAIPGLINAIKMIYSISRYYNTSERMTSLFVKITNQMITSCKEFVYKDYGPKLWDHERQPLVKKLIVNL